MNDGWGGVGEWGGGGGGQRGSLTFSYKCDITEDVICFQFVQSLKDLHAMLGSFIHAVDLSVQQPNLLPFRHLALVFPLLSFTHLTSSDLEKTTN